MEHLNKHPNQMGSKNNLLPSGVYVFVMATNLYFTMYLINPIGFNKVNKQEKLNLFLGIWSTFPVGFFFCWAWMRLCVGVFKINSMVNKKNTFLRLNVFFFTIHILVHSLPFISVWYVFNRPFTLYVPFNQPWLTGSIENGWCTLFFFSFKV